MTDGEDVDKTAKKNAQMLSRRFGFRDNVALSVAYKRLGFSASGTAKRVGVTQSTVKGYFKDIDERFGPEALFPHHAPDENDPLSGRSSRESEDSGTSDSPDSGGGADNGSVDGSLDPLSDFEALNGGGRDE